MRSKIYLEIESIKGKRRRGRKRRRRKTDTRNKKDQILQIMMKRTTLTKRMKILTMIIWKKVKNRRKR